MIMLWLLEECTISSFLSKILVALKPMIIICLTSGIPLIEINVIWLLGLVYFDEDHDKLLRLYRIPNFTIL